MNPSTLQVLRSPRILTTTTLAAILLLMTIPMSSNATSDEEAVTDELPLVQIRLDKRRTDLPPGVTLVVVGGGMMHNSFPALSADRSQLAILYYADRSMVPGYPALDFFSTGTLELKERLELFPSIEAERRSNLRDEQTLMGMEALLDDINVRLRKEGFRSIPQWYERHKHLSNNVDRFDKRLLSSWDESQEESIFSITSLATGELEFELLMPQIEVSRSPYPDAPELGCTVSGVVEQVWYEPDLRILILRMILGGSRDGCELPDRWILEHLGGIPD